MTDGKKPASSSVVSSSNLLAARGTGPGNGREEGEQIRNGLSGNGDAAARKDADVGDTTGYEGGREEPPHSKAAGLAKEAPRGKTRAGAGAAEETGDSTLRQ